MIGNHFQAGGVQVELRFAAARPALTCIRLTPRIADCFPFMGNNAKKSIS